MTVDPQRMPGEPGLPRDIGGPVFPGDPGQCKLDGHYYPEGTIKMIEGRPATCRQGNWLGEGDDPPFPPHHGPLPGPEPVA